MATRYYLYAGIVIGGALLGTALSRHQPAPGLPDQPSLASQLVPDLDGDQQPERLWIAQRDENSVWIKLDNSATPHTHDMLWVGAHAPFHFEGGDGHWRLIDGEGRTPATFTLIRPPKPAVTDLVAFAGENAVRYHWIDRGFLKLEATTVVPGFSVGLVMLRDTRPVLEAIGGPVGPDGRWKVPLPQPLEYRVAFNEGRVSRVGYDSPRFKTQVGVGPGADAKTLAAHYPGKRAGDRWLSPRYGLVAQLAGTDHAASFTISEPWRDQKDPPPASL